MLTTQIVQPAEDVAGPLGDEEEGLMDLIFSVNMEVPRGGKQ